MNEDDLDDYYGLVDSSYDDYSMESHRAREVRKQIYTAAKQAIKTQSPDSSQKPAPTTDKKPRAVDDLEKIGQEITTTDETAITALYWDEKYRTRVNQDKYENGDDLIVEDPRFYRITTTRIVTTEEITWDEWDTIRRAEKAVSSAANL